MERCWDMRVADVRVCVIGLWHLGCVYSACLAKLGYVVVGTDEDRRIVEDLRRGKPPIFEPGLDQLVAEGMACGRLSFVDDIGEGTENAEYAIIAYDMPVDAGDRPDPRLYFEP